MRLMIFGAGYSGRRIARAFAPHARWMVGTTRDEANFAALEAAGIEPHLFAGSVQDAEGLPLEYMTHLIVSIAPGDEGDPVLAAAREQIAHRMPALSWIGYLSTVGVYGDHGGGWVDEETECRPVSRRSVARQAAEREWLALGAETGIAVCVLRLSGIYGPGRNAFVNLEKGRARRIIKPGQVFNRIHVDDIAGACVHLAAARAEGIFNVTDGAPAPPQEVVVHAAALMGVNPPPEQDFASADMSAMARSFYGENKRVSNAKLLATGYRMTFADYGSALEAMWADGSWR